MIDSSVILPIIELIIAIFLGYASLKMYRLGNRYKTTGIGLGIMSFAFVAKALFTYLGIYTSSLWGLIESIDLIGAILIVWSILKK